MGLKNPRAICPECGAKIHTQAKGAGHLALAGRSPAMLKTGTRCPECGTALSGKVGIDNKAIRAEDADKGWWQRTKEEAGLGESGDLDEMDRELNRREAEWQASRPKRWWRR